MTGARSQRKPTFLWQGVLILLPVIVFAGLGVFLLQRDRTSVRQEAVDNARALANQIADYIGPRLTDRIEAQYRWALQAENRNPAPGTMMSESSGKRGDPDFEEFNVPMPQYRRFLALLTNHGHGAVGAASPMPRLILDAQGELLWPAPYPLAPTPGLGNGDSELASRPDSSAAARKQFQHAQALAAEGSAPEALALFSALATNNAPLTGETGVPLQPLASLGKLRLTDPADADATFNAASELASNTVAWPSLLTPLLLDEAVRAWPGPRPNGWESDPVWSRQFWGVEEDARIMHAHLRDNHVLPSLNRRPAALWTDWRNEPWLVLCASDVARTNDDHTVNSLVGLHFYPQVLIELGLLELLDQSKLRVPPYAGVSFEVAGRALPAITNTAVLAESPMTWVNRGRGEVAQRFGVERVSLPGLQVRLHLSRPDALFALQRGRELLFGGLLAASLLTAVIGWLAAYRAFHRQLRLNELKSNFVSSVSHELRAPIASVRLMAESLERGKVVENQQQRAYFGFIVQECRRLSALIENVLDFSRIEQGRKQYEFETTDLAALTRETVRLMEPYAAERGVKLETSNIEHRTSNIELEVDGRAIQQALVNLIDNAIKHSPKGETVTVGIGWEGERPREPHSPKDSSAREDARPPVIQLSVSDHGPGIPPEEHEKIFERFYRRGSELRRETQGVGIGLSIVKHIVEAHGGRVTVQSAVGEGSRFMIEIPLQNER